MSGNIGGGTHHGSGIIIPQRIVSDYEEGNWTPAWTSSGATITQEAVSGGEYIRIGDLVWIKGHFGTTESVTGTTSNAYYLTGLPFTHGTGSSAMILMGVPGHWGSAANSPQAMGIGADVGYAYFNKADTYGATAATAIASDMRTTGDSNQGAFSGFYNRQNSTNWGG